MKLFLIRHGQSEANLSLCYAGQTDSKLTELGRQQAVDVRPILSNIKFDRVYSSDLSRALETQKLALPAYTAETTPLLREFAVGSLAGKPFIKLESDPALASVRKRDYTPFGGENADMVYDRLRQFLSGLEENPCENVAAFVHNGIMLTMLRVAIGTDFDYGATRSGNCAVHVFDYDGKTWRLLSWNYMKPV